MAWGVVCPGPDALESANACDRPCGHLDSPSDGRPDTCRPCTCLYLCPCLFPCPGHRRTSIWEAFGCAWLATETAVKSGETVLPSYVVCPASRIYLFVPWW